MFCLHKDDVIATSMNLGTNMVYDWFMSFEIGSIHTHAAPNAWHFG